MTPLAHPQLDSLFLFEDKSRFTLAEWHRAVWHCAKEIVSSHTRLLIVLRRKIKVGLLHLQAQKFETQSAVILRSDEATNNFLCPQMLLKETLTQIVGVWPYKVWCCWIRVWRNSYRINSPADHNLDNIQHTPWMLPAWDWWTSCCGDSQTFLNILLHKYVMFLDRDSVSFSCL